MRKRSSHAGAYQPLLLAWARETTGVIDATYATTTAAFDGKRAQKITIACTRGGRAGLSIIADGGVCTPRVFAGRHYELSAHYTASTPPRFRIRYRDREGEWHALPDSPAFAAAQSYALAPISGVGSRTPVRNSRDCGCPNSHMWQRPARALNNPRERRLSRKTSREVGGLDDSSISFVADRARCMRV